MDLYIKQFTILLLLQIIFGFKIAIAQETDFFIGKPDKNIKRVVVYDVDIEKDTAYLNYIVEFNKQGRVIKELQPGVHIRVEYKYDKKGRLLLKDALYGESFANGTTDYLYSNGVEIEKNRAMGFYSEIRKEFDKDEKILKEQAFYVAGGMGESKIETIYQYNKDNLLSKKSITINKYDLEIEPGEVTEMKPDVLVKELKKSKLIKKESFVEVYKYNSAKKLVLKELLNADTEGVQYQITYEYNVNGLLIKEVKVCIESLENQVNIPCEETTIERKYTIKNKLESITTQRDHSLSIETYKDGRLVSSYYRYAAIDSYQYSYKYEYYTD